MTPPILTITRSHIILHPMTLGMTQRGFTDQNPYYILYPLLSQILQLFEGVCRAKCQTLLTPSLFHFLFLFFNLYGTLKEYIYI